jgi:hypothetical protein
MTKPSKPNVSEHEIAARAYQVWEAAGRPHGRAMEHWLAAEAQLRGAAELRQSSRLPGNRYGLVLKS